ncbi:hypothetical protein B9Z55_000115 [Caenorhabditis nigoni]|uniref:Uncharacterized protein n=1 Tax=Caenorhabditis nigoni TaxID=1611254 RepID=A0A2G5VEC8_9PELO|nr:hypothetical protein B9Z55_000115 [Caenorhabditis nigoni]
MATKAQSRLNELEKKREEVEIAESAVVDRAGNRKSREEQLKDLDMQLQNIRTYLEHSQLQVKFYQCKRDNRPSPFEMFIQQTKTSLDGTVYIERVHYNKSLNDAEKYLINKFLGNRQVVAKIQTLGFWPNRNRSPVIHLPKGLKLDVEEFGTFGNLSKVLERVENLLEHPNRPLARLETVSMKLEEFQHSIAQNAQVLVLSHLFAMENTSLYLTLTNKKIVISYDERASPAEYIELVTGIMDTKGTLGTLCYEIHVAKEEKAEAVLSAIGERFENAQVGERLITIPLSGVMQLKVSYMPNPDDHGYTWRIRMEVVQNHDN